MNVGDLPPSSRSASGSQAVRLTGLSRSRLYESMKSGDIEFVKVGSSTLILLESQRSFLGARLVQKWSHLNGLAARAASLR
jgi:predicted DNA-binding transcriptional regulator AlpA